MLVEVGLRRQVFSSLIYLSKGNMFLFDCHKIEELW